MKKNTIRMFVAGVHLLLLSSMLIFVLSSCDHDDEEQGPPLVIESISPTRARVGETITITGTGFIAKPSRNDIGFTGRSSPIPAQVLEATATTLKIKVPLEALDGPLEIIVGGKTVTSTQSFTLDTSLGAPTVASISPDNGFVNTEVTITGTNFGTDKNAVKVFFGTTAATDVVAVTDKTVKVKAPVSLPAGEVDVKVEREGMASATSVKFTVKATPPTVTTAYYVDGNRIWKGVVDAEGIHIDMLYDLSTATGAVCVAADVEGGYLYWGRFRGISRAPIDGKGPVEDIYEDPDRIMVAGDITVDPATKALYFSSIDLSFSRSYIFKGNFDGTAPLNVLSDDIFDNLPYNLKLSTATNTLYWAELMSQRIRAASLSGAFTPVTLFDADKGVRGPTGIALDEKAGKIYITANGQMIGTGESSILAGNIDGTGSLTVLIAPGPDVRSPVDTEIDVINGYIFWMNTTIDQTSASDIMRVKLDGTGIEKMFDGFENGAGLILDIR